MDIGTVHVSGVSCLIQNPKFQRGMCVGQYHGGLRCYPGMAPMLTVPTVAAGAQQPGAMVGAEEEAGALSAYCLYGPEEETRDDPLCRL